MYIYYAGLENFRIEVIETEPITYPFLLRLFLILCSENYIFGKFDTFCKRLEKVDDSTNTIDTDAGVGDLRIEVLETESMIYPAMLSLFLTLFSENYIFGKFDTFCKRLEKIADMINTMDAYAGLGDVRIEGIETIAVRYKTVVDATKKKNYDILDHRKGEVSAEIKRDLLST